VVSIRQDHASLAEVELKVKVVQRTWVTLCGAITLALPGLSAVLKHFGLDFESQQDRGFSLYLAAANLLFDKVSPLVLTATLGLVTGVLWWLTRPQRRDVFWDIKTVSPAEKLKQIAAVVESDPDQAVRELTDLLKAFPDYQPARLFYAEWHYDARNYSEALRAYERAFTGGVTKARHYLRASLSASKMGRDATALRILQEAEQALPPEEMMSVMLYNMGCYHARLRNPNKALAYLRRAVAAGYTKAASFQKDPDLACLRPLPAFRRLLAEDLTVHFKCHKCDKAVWARAKFASKKAKCPRCKATMSIPTTD
jgi:tetratricopeptide (TPR) repeat protein